MHRTVQAAVDRALRFAVQTGSVDVKDLPARRIGDAEDALARGVRARRDDGEMRIDQRVQQRGLADVGTPDDRNASTTE